MRRTISAAVCCLLLLLTACESRTGPDDQPSPPPGPDLHSVTIPREVGTGLLNGMSLDGSAAFVEEPDPAFPQLGCEGQPEPVMFRLPLEGGEREPVAGETALHGNLVRGGSNGRVAVIAACESFLTSLYVGTETPDGRLTDPTALTVQEPENFLLNPASVSWSSDGSRLVGALQHVDQPDGDAPRIVAIDPVTGAVTRLFDAELGTGVLRVGQTEDGSYVIASNLVVSLHGESGESRGRFSGKDFEISPDRRRVIAFGAEITLIEQGSTSHTDVQPATEGWEISSVKFSPAGDAVAISRYSLGDGLVDIGIVTLGDNRYSSVVTGGRYGGPHFTGDGAGVAFTRFGSEPDFTSRVFLTRFE